MSKIITKSIFLYYFKLCRQQAFGEGMDVAKINNAKKKMKGQLFVDLVGADWLVSSPLSGMEGKAKREPRGASKPKNELV